MPELIDRSPAQGWIQIDGHKLILNGQGTHSVFVFKVYDISLFLEKRSSDAAALLSSSDRKVILLKFLRDVSGDQLRSALSDGFNENCDNRCSQLKGNLDEINSKIPDFKEGDSLMLEFLPSQLILESARGSRIQLANSSLNRILLSIWIGSDPPSDSLKKSLLGLPD